MRVPLKLSSRRSAARTLVLTRPGTVRLPPICLVTSVGGVAPVHALGALITFTLVPAVLTRIAQNRQSPAARTAARTAAAHADAANPDAATDAARAADVAEAVAAGADPTLAAQQWDAARAAEADTKAAAAVAAEAEAAAVGLITRAHGA